MNRNLAHASSWTIRVFLFCLLVLGEKMVLAAGSGVRKSSNSASSSPRSVVINELYFDGPTILDVEFVELYGPANTSLKGLSFVVVDSTSKSHPRILFRLDFQRNHTLGCNGFFLVGNDQVEVRKGVKPDLFIEHAAWKDGTSLTVALVETKSLKKTDWLLTGHERAHSAVGLASGLAPRPRYHFDAPVLDKDYPVGFTRRPKGSNTLVPYTGWDEAKTTPRAATPCPKEEVQATPESSSTTSTGNGNTKTSTTEAATQSSSEDGKHCPAMEKAESNPASMATASAL